MFGSKHTQNIHKRNVYTMIDSLIDGYEGTKRHILDMAWLNFTLSLNLIEKHPNFIIHNFEMDNSVYQLQKRALCELNVPKSKIKLFNENVADGIYKRKNHHKYLFAFLDFCGFMSKSMVTSLMYVNAEYIALTVMLKRESENSYWNKQVKQGIDREVTHSVEFERAGYEEIDRYNYTGEGRYGAPMRVYFLKKYNMEIYKETYEDLDILKKFIPNSELRIIDGKLHVYIDNISLTWVSGSDQYVNGYAAGILKGILHGKKHFNSIKQN